MRCRRSVTLLHSFPQMVSGLPHEVGGSFPAGVNGALTKNVSQKNLVVRMTVHDGEPRKRLSGSRRLSLSNGRIVGLGFPSDTSQPNQRQPIPRSGASEQRKLQRIDRHRPPIVAHENPIKKAGVVAPAAERTSRPIFVSTYTRKSGFCLAL